MVIFSEGLAKVAEQYLKKGAKVYLEGQLQTRKWQDQQGQDNYTTEVVLQGFNSALTMLDRAGGGGWWRRLRLRRCRIWRSSPTAPRRPAVAAVGAGAGGGRRQERRPQRRNPVLVSGPVGKITGRGRDGKAAVRSTNNRRSHELTGLARQTTVSCTVHEWCGRTRLKT